MADHNTREGKFRRGFGGVALGGALAAFFISPLIRFANPIGLAVFGSLAGVGLLGLYNSRVVPGVKPGTEKVAWIVLLSGAVGLGFILSFAGTASLSLDRYCANLQRRMINAERSKAATGELKDIIQTLQCRPMEPPLPVVGEPAAQRLIR